MLKAVKGYCDGTHIVMVEDVKMDAGQEVIISILDAKKRSAKKIDLRRYMVRGPKMFQGDAQEYVKELRDNDRI